MAGCKLPVKLELVGSSLPEAVDALTSSFEVVPSRIFEESLGTAGADGEDVVGAALLVIQSSFFD